MWAALGTLYQLLDLKTRSRVSDRNDWIPSEEGEEGWRWNVLMRESGAFSDRTADFRSPIMIHPFVQPDATCASPKLTQRSS